LAPEVDALESDIAALQDAQNLEELGAGLDAVLSQAQVIYDDVTDTASCDCARRRGEARPMLVAPRVPPDSGART
jgi:hypothetical protein